MKKHIVDQKKLAKIISKYPAIESVYLIGSGAQNTARKDSDLDIVLVIGEKQPFSPNDFDTLYQKINSITTHPNLDLRIIIPEKTDPLFLFQLLKGKLLFKRNPKKHIEMESKFMRLYHDTQCLRDIFHYYLNKRLDGGFYGR